MLFWPWVVDCVRTISASRPPDPSWGLPAGDGPVTQWRKNPKEHKTPLTLPVTLFLSFWNVKCLLWYQHCSHGSVPAETLGVAWGSPKHACDWWDVLGWPEGRVSCLHEPVWRIWMEAPQNPSTLLFSFLKLYSCLNKKKCKRRWKLERCLKW
jgi:hypothetical protein